MKTRILIIAFLIASLLFALSFTSKAQHCGSVATLIDTALIADETTLTYTKTGAKIVTFSKEIFEKISLTWGSEFKSIAFIKYKCGHDRYKEYVIYLSQQTANNIYQWAKKNL